MAGPITRQARSEARLRFGPQRFALQELIAQAVQTRDANLHAAAGADRAIQMILGRARRETTRNYAQAGAAGAGTTAMVGEALAPLGPGADPFRAAIAREGGVGANRLTEGRTDALQELTNRRLEATSGRAYAQQAATRQYSADIGKVGRSYLELAGEEGAFTQGRTGELRREAADRAFQRDLAIFNQRQATARTRIQARTQRRGQRISARTQRRGQQISAETQQRGQDLTRRGQDLSHADRQAAIRQRRQAAARNRIGSRGPKLATPESHTALWQSIQSALPDARNQKGHGRSYGETANLLTNGRRQQSIQDPSRVDPSTKKPVKLTVPGINKRGRLAAIVAADYAYYGGITQRTMNILHSRGYSTRNLKLKRAPASRRPGGRGQGGPYGTGRMGR